MRFPRQVWEIVRGDRLWVIVSVISALVFAAMSLVPPLVIRRMIQWLTQGGGTTRGLSFLCIILIGAYGLRGLCRYAYGRFSHDAAYHIMHRLMVRVYGHLQGLSHKYFSDQRSGGLTARTINDIEAVEDFIAHGLPQLTLALTIPASMILFLLNLDWRLTLLALAPVPLITALVYAVAKRSSGLFRKAREGLGNLTAQVQENLSGILVIQSFVREGDRAQEIDNHSRNFRDSMKAANRATKIPSGLVEFGSGLGMAVVVLAGGRAAMTGALPVADLYLFATYLAYIYQPFLQLADIQDAIQKASASLERVFQVLELKPEITSPKRALSPEDPSWELSFRNVSFAYRAGDPVLQGVDLEIPQGGVAALVGSTGAGKTTLARLVPRFLDVQAGEVRIAGHDVRTLDLSWLRRHVAVVDQDVFLFHGTVRDNIGFGLAGAGEEEIHEAARLANAEEFIQRLPEAYDTIIGERGIKLSGGQKQRLSIARALLKDAPILILDEATSSVDVESEAFIQEALARLAKKRTTLIIAHRLSTVRDADRIYVLDSGRVVEHGDHEELLAASGIYARMVRGQITAPSPILES